MACNNIVYITKHKAIEEMMAEAGFAKIKEEINIQKAFESKKNLLK